MNFANVLTVGVFVAVFSRAAVAVAPSFDLIFSYEVQENSATVDAFKLIGADDEDDPLTFTVISQTPTTPQFTLTDDVLKSPAELDYESTSSFTFVFGVKDPTSVVVESVPTVLEIGDVNEKPNSNAVGYNTDLQYPGTMQDGDVIVTLTESDPDTQATNLQYNTLTYTVVSADSTVIFYGLDASSGELTVTDTVLVGTLCGVSVVIQVEVADGMGLIADSNVAVTINIMCNTNANAPEIQGEPITGTVLEDAGAGTTILTVIATDVDTPIVYTVDSTLFEIGSTSGEITVKSDNSLDYASSPYELVVTATDGAGTPKSSTATVTIVVKTTPVWVKPAPGETDSMNIPESSAGGFNVYTVEASDKDTPDTLVYTLVSQTPATKFVMEGASIKVMADATFDVDGDTAVTSYTLAISVSDGTYTADETSVVISITDANDNAPVFDSTRVYTAQLFEDQYLDTEGKFFSMLFAEDGDRTSPNNKVVFSIQGTSPFAIDSSSGELSVVSLLDYANSPYTVTITATDSPEVGSPLFVTKDFIVSVVTVPVWVKPAPGATGSMNIPETSAGGSNVYTVEASDKDTPGTLVYTLVSQTPATKFVMDGAIIKVMADATFDVDGDNAVTSYTLAISLSDGTYTADETSVVISITDANDNAPVFDSTAQYTKNILEDIATDTSVMTVQAVDDDLTAPNNDVKYTISANSAFRVDVSTGVIYTTALLDYTSDRTYTLTVTASDSPSSGVRTAEQPVTINIKTKPVFTKPLADHTRDIPEGNALDRTIYTVAATDEDDEGLLAFSIKSQTPDSVTMFYLDGVILKSSKTVPLDAESIAAFEIVFSVTDGMTEVTSSKLTINVQDVNDMIPEFSEAAYTVTIDENKATGSDVIRVSATDDDITSPFKTITFSVTAGNEDSMFTLSGSTGQITLAKPPNKVVYMLTVQAADGGIPSNVVDVSVIISINADAVDECADSPCENEAVCRAHVNYYSCICLPGWTGRQCQTNIDECLGDPCDNNGDCIDGVNSFTCNCTAGWHEQTCATECTGHTYGRNCAQSCECDSSKISADASSQHCNTQTGVCICNDKWSGDTCQTDVDECAANGAEPCKDIQNTGCLNTDGGHLCDCLLGFKANDAGACVTDTTPAIDETAAEGEYKIEATITLNSTYSDNLGVVTENSRVSIIVAVMLKEELLAKRVIIKSVSLGSLVIDFIAFIDDTTESIVKAAQNFQALREGKSSELMGETVSTKDLNISGVALSTTNSASGSGQLCESYTAVSPCAVGYECQLQSGTPFCREIEEDNIGLILGLGLGLPLALLAILIVCILAWFIVRSKKGYRYGNKRHHSRGDSANGYTIDRRDAYGLKTVEHSRQKHRY